MRDCDLGYPELPCQSTNLPAKWVGKKASPGPCYYENDAVFVLNYLEFDVLW